MNRSSFRLGRSTNVFRSAGIVGLMYYLALLTACGQSGPLMLPNSEPDTAAIPSTNPSTSNEADEEDDSER